MGRPCAVYGCKNFETKTRKQGSGIRYYSFSTLPWMQDKIKHWIAFANRQTVEGKPWAPNKNSRICSAHFVGGAKGEDPRKPNYYPTIYPPQGFTNNQDQVQSKSKLSNTVKTVTKKTANLRLDPQTAATTVSLKMAELKTKRPLNFSKKEVTMPLAPTTSNTVTSICSAESEIQTQAVEPAPIIPKDEAPKGILRRKRMGPHVHDCILCGSTNSCSQIGEAHQNKWSSNICSLFNVQETDGDGVPTKDKIKDIIQAATYCGECLDDLKNIEKINGQIKRAQTQLQKIKVGYQTKLKDFLRRSLKKQSREKNDDEIPAEHTLEFQAKRKREILFRYMHGAPITQFIGQRWAKNCVTTTPSPDLLQNEDQDPEFEALDSGGQEMNHEPEDTLMDCNKTAVVDVSPNVNVISNSPLASPLPLHKKFCTKTSSNVSSPSNISTPPQPSEPPLPEETDSAKIALLLRQHKIKDFSINLVNLALPTKSGSVSVRTKRISSKVLAEQVIIRKSQPAQIIRSNKIPNSHLYKRSTYICPLPACAKTYTLLKDFQKHMKYGVHEGDSPGFPCTEPECFGKTSFPTQRGLALHQRQLHMIDSTAPKYVLCETCGTSYVAKKRHLHLKSTAHNRKEGDGHLRCKFCELTFSHLKVFREHRATHPEFHAQRKENEFLCQYCSKFFYKKWALKDHEMLHTKNFPHLCHICAFGTAQKSTVKTHLLGKHGVPWETLTMADTGTGSCGEPEPERHECPICKKIFTSWKKFKNHTEFDNGDKKIFKCNLCLMEFCVQKDYVRHEFYHNKPRKPISHCTVCNRMFVLEKNLKTHMDQEHPATATATATFKSD